MATSKEAGKDNIPAAKAKAAKTTLVLEVGPTSGEKLQAMVATMMASPADVVEKYGKAVAPAK